MTEVRDLSSWSIGVRDLHLYSHKNISSRAIGDILKYYYEVPNSKEKNDELLAMIIKWMKYSDSLNFGDDIYCIRF